MKKTLLTMLVLAGMTCAYGAASWDSPILTMTTVESNYDTSSLGLGSSYTLTMSLDVDQCRKTFPDGSLISNIPSTLALFSTTNTGTEETPSYSYVGINVNYSSNNNKTSASGLYGTTSNSRGNRVLAGNVSDLSEIGWDNVTAAALTMTVYAANGNAGSGDNLVYNGTAVTLFLQTTDGYVSYFGQNSSQRYSTFSHGSLKLDNNLITKAYLFNGAATVGEVEAMNWHMIPEPTTATLSLLALCGLAARRRRK